MPTNAENQGNEPFVKRVEMAIMQYVMLDRAQQGEVTKENLRQPFRGALQMSSDHFDHCLDELIEGEHLEEVDGKYKITDDGREDIHKLEGLMLELPNVVQRSAGQSRSAQPSAPGQAGRSGAPQGRDVGQGGPPGAR